MPLSAALVPACRAFNERLLRHGEPPFLLPDSAPEERPAGATKPASAHYVAVDAEGAVRGGVLVVEHRGWFEERDVPVLNIQSPLSEGIADRAFAGVGLQMLRFVLQRNPRCYAIGMGGEQSPFARFLKAAGWGVSPVPFQFAVIHASRFLREAGPLRQGNKRKMARLAAASGLGALAAMAWRGTHRAPPGRGYSLEAAEPEWPEELNGIWQRCRGSFAFAVTRDARGASELHPRGQPRLQRYVLRSRGDVAGWSAAKITAMRDNPHFGNLTVGTVLDAIAPPEHLTVLLAKTRDALCDLGADLILANYTHAVWREQLRKLGFLAGPSNYMAAVSRAVSKGLMPAPRGSERAYVTRADGDGRLNL